MNDRLEIICSHLGEGDTFADVGCDHGFCAKYVLDRRLYRTVYISDISAGSLKKAQSLLKQEIDAGSCIPVLADGMKGLPTRCDCVLIAGLGGEEIVRILQEGYLPPRFVLQPMKNSDKVRSFLLRNGCRILSDYTFGEGYYYDLIVGEGTGGDRYSDWELLYGRDNLRAPSPSFLAKQREEREKLRAYLERKMQPSRREQVRERLNRIDVLLDAIEGDTE